MAVGEVTPLLTTDQYDGNAKYPDHNEFQFLQFDVLVACPHSSTMSDPPDALMHVYSTTHCEHGKLSPISSTQHLSLLSALPWASDRVASLPLFLSHALAAFPFNGVAL